jgi:WD40 repeat protein
MRALDDELTTLPQRLRDPIVLCYLEGHTRDEAAELLGCSLSMLLRRLDRGRKVLRARLARRGVALAAAGLGVLLTDPPVSAATATTTARAATAFTSSGQAAPTVATLLEFSSVGVRLKATALLLFGLVACGVGALASSAALVGPRDKGAVGARAPDDAKPDAPSAPAPAGAPGDPLPTGAVARLGSGRLRAGSGVHRMAFSPDGTKLVSWSDAWGDSPAVLAVWDAKSGRPLRRVELPGLRADSITWRADGRGVALIHSASEATTPVAWEFTDADAPAPKPLPPKPPPPPKNAPAGVPLVFEGDSCQAVSADGRTAAVVRGGFAGQPRRLLLVPLALGGAVEPGADAKVLVELPANPAEVRFAPDGKTLVVFSKSDQLAAEQPVTAWDVATGKEKSRFTAPAPASNGGQRAVAVSDRHLAIGLPDGESSLWDLSTGKERKFATGHGRKATGGSAGTYAVAFASGGKTLVTGGRDDLVKLWDADSGKHLSTLRGHTPVEALAVSADGKTVASAGQDGLIRLWDAATGADACPQTGHKGAVTAAALSPDGKVAVTGGMDRTLRLWDATGGKELRMIELGELVTALCVDPDGRTVLAAVGGKRLRTWDLGTGKETTPADLAVDILSGGQALDQFIFTPDARHLVVASGRQVSVLAWPGLTAVRRIELPKPAKEPGETVGGLVAVSPDGRQLVTLARRHWREGQGGYGADGVADVWDLATGKCVRRLAESPGTFRSAAFTPDGRVVLVGVGGGTVPVGGAFAGEINLLDPAGGRWVRSFTAPVGPAGARLRYPGTAVTSPDGRTLYVSYDSGEVLGFEVATGKVRRSLTGHRRSVLALGLSPDGRRLVSGGLDGTALVWDTTLAGGAKPRAAALTADEVKALWAEATGPYPRAAFAALADLAAAPDLAIALTRAEVKPAPAGPTEAELDRVLKNLGSEEFATREKASKELTGFGESAVPGVRKRVAATESPEVRQRAAAFLARFDPAIPSPSRVREVRAVELLEGIGTPGAKKLLEELAAGAPSASLTLDAAAALRRLGNR